MRACWYDTAAGRRVEVTAGSGEPLYALRDDHTDEATARSASLKRGTKTLSLTLKPGLLTVTAREIFPQATVAAIGRHKAHPNCQ